MSDTPMPTTRDELYEWLAAVGTGRGVVGWPAACAILSALDNAGLAIVPKKATEEMIDAGFIDGDTDDIWTAMLSASPYAVMSGIVEKARAALGDKP